MLRKVFKPKIVIPLVFAVVLIGFVLSLGDIRKVGQDLVDFPKGAAAVIFLLVVIYEVARGIQWLYFLRGMGVKVDRRRGIFAFVGGEAAKSLPAGNYFQNYLLEREKGVAVAYTAAGTTVTILLEVAVCICYVAIVGVGSWTWVRPTIIVGVLAVAAVGLLIWRLNLHARAPKRIRDSRWYQWLGEQGGNFLKGARSFVSLRLLLVGFVLAVVYLAAAGTQYYVVIRGLGIGNVSYWHAVSAYLFGLGVGLIMPVPTDIGIQELSGLGALSALGIDETRAVAIVIIFRILNLVSSILIAAGTFVVLHKELAEALSSRRRKSEVPGQADTEGTAPRRAATGAK